MLDMIGTAAAAALASVGKRRRFSQVMHDPNDPARLERIRLQRERQEKEQRARQAHCAARRTWRSTPGMTGKQYRRMIKRMRREMRAQRPTV